MGDDLNSVARGPLSPRKKARPTHPGVPPGSSAWRASRARVPSFHCQATRTAWGAEVLSPERNNGVRHSEPSEKTRRHSPTGEKDLQLLGEPIAREAPADAWRLTWPCPRSLREDRLTPPSARRHRRRAAEDFSTARSKLSAAQSLRSSAPFKSPALNSDRERP